MRGTLKSATRTLTGSGSGRRLALLPLLLLLLLLPVLAAGGRCAELLELAFELPALLLLLFDPARLEASEAPAAGRGNLEALLLAAPLLPFVLLLALALVLVLLLLLLLLLPP